MSRSVFVSACGDPFLLMLTYKLFKERWYDEVDEFLICLNNNVHAPQDVIGELLLRLSFDPKVNIIYHPNGIGNGTPITEMTYVSQKKHVMLLEDDFFIFTSGEVDKCFKLLEEDQADIIGSPRFSCSNEIAEALKKKYNLDYSGYGDRGPLLWPTMFFCKRDDLLKTDMNFGSYHFPKGKYFSELDWTFSEDNHADTFGWGMIQLRTLDPRIHEIPQHKADPYEVENKTINMMNWHQSQQPFNYIHGGSLSAGWSGYLGEATPDVSTEGSKREIETRVSFWKICSDVVEGFDTFKIEYRKGINGLIERAELDQSRIQQKYNLYKNIMKV